jgi:hypothetical protein
LHQARAGRLLLKAVGPIVLLPACFGVGGWTLRDYLVATSESGTFLLFAAVMLPCR